MSVKASIVVFANVGLIDRFGKAGATKDVFTQITTVIPNDNVNAVGVGVYEARLQASNTV